MPLTSLARAIARFAKPVEQSQTRDETIYRMHKAFANNALNAADRGTIVRALCDVTKGAVLAKTGAEGILVTVPPAQCLGVSLKITDGTARSRSAGPLAILNHRGVLSKT